MGASKKYQYTANQNRLSTTAKALGHSARVTILQHLRNHGFITHQEAMFITQLSDGTISQHIKELVSAKLVAEIWIDRHYYVLARDAQKRIQKLSELIG